MLIGDEEGTVPDVDVTDGAEPGDGNGAGAEGQPAENGTDKLDGTEETQDPKSEHGWRKRVDSLTKQRTELREKATTAETKVSELTTELETLRGSVGDETVLSAAQAAGVLPQFIDKQGAQLLEQADKLERQLTFWESHVGGEGETFEVGGQSYTGRQAAGFAATLRSQLRQVSGRADAVRQKAVDRHKSLLDLGMAAEKAGWKPGAKGAATATTQTATRKPSSPPPLPGDAGGTRQPTTRGKAVPEIDFTKIKDRDEYQEALAEQARRNMTAA